jgi:hypothetical protein
VSDLQVRFELLGPHRAPRTAGQLLALIDGGYRLAVATGGSDVDVYETQVSSALHGRNAGRLEEASQHLQHALALWRSDPLEGLAGSAFEAARRRLLEHRAGAVEEYAEIELELGRHELLAEDRPHRFAGSGHWRHFGQRGLFPSPLPAAVAEFLVILPPADDAPPRP